MVDTYLADNGVFKANRFVKKICDHNQRILYCGVNAHHKKCITERLIRTVSEMACSIMLHLYLCCKNNIG